MSKQKLSLPLYLGLFVVLFFIFKNVNLYGDDFHYAVFSKQDLAYYFQRNYQHYILANGRAFVHILITFFLWTPLIVWQILCSFMIVCIIFLIQKIAGLKENLCFSIGICTLIFFTIDLLITRQSIYWLTGSFNYVYPILMLLIYWRLIQKNSKLIPFCAIFASQSVEQASMMAFGVMVIYIAKNYFFDGIKPTKRYIYGLIINILGLLSIFLAPGTFNRLDQTPVEQSYISFLLENISNQSQTLFFSSAMLKTHLIVSGFLAFYCLIRYIQNRAIANMSLLISFGLIFVNYALFFFNLPHFSNNLIAFIYVTLLFIVAIIEFANYENIVPTTALILGLGSQIMMIVSPVYGFRIILGFIFMIMLFVASLLKNLQIDHRLLTILTIITCLLGVFSAKTEYDGYRINNVIYTQNIENLENGIYTQKRMPIDICRWAMPYDNSYYDIYYVLTFDLSRDIEIIWN